MLSTDLGWIVLGSRRDVRGRWSLRTPGSGKSRLPRPLRASAPRPGVGRHRLDRRHRLRAVREMGHVNDIFTAARLKDLPGFAAIGHVRYSTAGDSSKKNAQPIAVDYVGGSVAVGHNGNLVNAVELREQLEAEGAIFQTSSDTECIVHLIARSREQTLPERAADALRQVRGAYSLVFLTENRWSRCAIRWGSGRSRWASPGQGRTWVVSSETCAFELLEAEFVRDIEPGEMVIIDESTACAAVRPFGDAAAAPLRLRVGLLRASRLDHRRALGLPRARADGAQAGGRARRPRRRRHPGPRLGRRGRHRLRARERHPLRPGADALALHGADVHRAVAADPPLRREAEAVARARGAERQASGRGRRLDRARHDLAQDRRDDPGRGRARGAHAHQLAAHDRSLPLRHRHADARGADRVVAHARADPRVRGRRFARLPVAGGAARIRQRRRATAPGTVSATPASRTTTRSPSSSRRACASCG